jgi:hypothetical protein
MVACVWLVVWGCLVRRGCFVGHQSLCQPPPIQGHPRQRRSRLGSDGGAFSLDATLAQPSQPRQEQQEQALEHHTMEIVPLCWGCGKACLGLSVLASLPPLPSSSRLPTHSTIPSFPLSTTHTQPAALRVGCLRRWRTRRTTPCGSLW